MFSLVTFYNNDLCVISSKAIKQCEGKYCRVKYKGATYSAQIISQSDNKDDLLELKKGRKANQTPSTSGKENSTFDLEIQSMVNMEGNINAGEVEPLWNMQDISSSTLSVIKEYLRNLYPAGSEENLSVTSSLFGVFKRNENNCSNPVDNEIIASAVTSNNGRTSVSENNGPELQSSQKCTKTTVNETNDSHDQSDNASTSTNSSHEYFQDSDSSWEMSSEYSVDSSSSDEIALNKICLVDRNNRNTPIALELPNSTNVPEKTVPECQTDSSLKPIGPLHVSEAKHKSNDCTPVSENNRPELQFSHKCSKTTVNKISDSHVLKEITSFCNNSSVEHFRDSDCSWDISSNYSENSSDESLFEDITLKKNPLDEQKNWKNPTPLESPNTINVPEKRDVGCQTDLSLKDIDTLIFSGPKHKTKQHFCLFCKTLQSKISRHLFSKHKEEKLVHQAMQLPKQNPKRLEIINDLRKQGDFLYNTSVEQNTGQLILPRRSRENHADYKDNNYVCCTNCKGFYRKYTLRSHLSKCGKNKSYSSENKTGAGDTSLIYGKERLASSLAAETVDEYRPSCSNGMSVAENCSAPSIKANKTNTTSFVDPLIIPVSQNKCKQHFCVFCKTLQCAISRHFFLKHRNEDLIKKAMRLPKQSKERSKIIESLRKEGDFLHNTSRDQNSGILIVARRQRQTTNYNADDYICCPKCKGFYGKFAARLHLRKCVKTKNSRTNFIEGRKLTQYVHPVANQNMKTSIFPVLMNDEITRALRYDELIIKYGNRLSEKLPHARHHEQIRGSLRLLGRFKLELIKLAPDITEMKDIFTPSLFDRIREAFRKTAKWDNKQGFATPAVAAHLSSLIKNCAKLQGNEFIQRHEDNKKSLLDEFVSLWVEKNPVTVDTKILRYQENQGTALSDEELCSGSNTTNPGETTNATSTSFGKIKRTRWTKEEKRAINEIFGDIFALERLPSLMECAEAIKNNNALRQRTPPQIKTWIDNQRKRGKD
ncbi:uncharacterized protein [Musca autumnalis]|uniref:uncharacterized protein n=1 Tax=Musca autumnalis TaxID=221902 RepID=UPI003CE9CF21